MGNGMLTLYDAVWELPCVILSVRAGPATRHARVELQGALIVYIDFIDNPHPVKVRQEGEKERQVSLETPGERLRAPLRSLPEILEHPICKYPGGWGNAGDKLQSPEKALHLATCGPLFAPPPAQHGHNLC